MSELLGGTVIGFVTITVVITGFAAFMAGHAIANTWRPYWQVLIYCGLLSAAARFFNYALADGRLLSWSGYLVDLAVLVGIGSLAYGLTRARKMVSQYPWLYERVGPFSWRARR